MDTPLRENCADTPFLIPTIPWAHEKCGILEQFKLVTKRLPKNVQSFLYTNLVDPFYVQLRQNAGDPTSIPRSQRLILLYQCIKRCQHEDVPYVICAISLITGFPPKIILDHNRIHLPQAKVDIIQAFHTKAARHNAEPIYAFSGRIEVTEMAESLPSTLLWTLPTNPLQNIELPAFPPNNSDKLTEEQQKLLVPVSADELPDYISEQQRYYILNPRIRKSLKMPFFYSPDLSDGFNPAHGLPPVPCFNEFDDQRPPQIRWIADLELPDTIPATYKGCKCVNCDCCHCHILTFPDNQRTMCYTKDGRVDLQELNECRPLIIECNEKCLCHKLHCKNRVVQNRSRVQLMVIRSKSKSGWGVRTMEFIPRGAFVCEYLGQVISDPLVAEIMGREYDDNLESYLFDLDAYGVDDCDMLTVDPSRVGNVSKYINHSCDPNLVQISIGTVESPLFHRIAFFATRNIYPNEELGFHYNYELDVDPNRFIECNCGCLICRTRLR
ncbi:Pre-SET motif family protein [Tritrichomonas foetus]|uniref:Pre-SET motif family protein n=1 Tax=Tritrichomonas foetus TaxID=1144522 RepID=A0A1J4KUY2_9EUKA|nr:Pre-SET motif family protein [Tritrichomonas foetus]|eukprot:OHT13548.1 Pre-SET motif family protein [Tritrichomonas foetus]